MNKLTKIFGLAAVCGLMPVMAQAEIPDIANVHPGTPISISGGTTYSVLDGRIEPIATDQDIYCFSNGSGFTHWKITFGNVGFLGGGLTINVYRGDALGSGTLVNATKFSGHTESYKVAVGPTEKTYIAILRGPGTFFSGSYRLTVTGSDAVANAKLVSEKASLWNWANDRVKKYHKRYKKYQKRYKKAKKAKNSAKAKKYKKRYKKDKKKRDNYKKRRGVFAAELAAAQAL